MLALINTVKTRLILLALVVPIISFAQENMHIRNASGGGQQGCALKVIVNFSKVEPFSFRIGLSGGVGGFIGDNRWMYPALNSDIMFFRGGIGSAYPGLKGKRGFELEVIISYSATFGGPNRFVSNSPYAPGIRSYPLYYFNNLTLPALQNPFNWSLTWGGNVVFFPTKKTQKAWQLVGFINLHGDRVQVSYINDGPPFFLPFGDKYDRYHTGGGFISFHGDNDWAVNLVELGYNKFTGYDERSYELSNKLGSAYVLYADTVENYYNKGNWILNVANTARNFGISLAPLNYRHLDVQHGIHEARHFPLHIVPYPNSFSGGPGAYAQYLRIAIKDEQE